MSGLSKAEFHADSKLQLGIDVGGVTARQVTVQLHVVREPDPQLTLGEHEAHATAVATGDEQHARPWFGLHRTICVRGDRQ